MKSIIYSYLTYLTSTLADGPPKLGRQAGRVLGTVFNTKHKSGEYAVGMDDMGSGCFQVHTAVLLLLLLMAAISAAEVETAPNTPPCFLIMETAAEWFNGSVAAQQS